MSKVVKGVSRAIGKVVKGAVNLVKKVAKSKFGRIALMAATVYFGGAAIMGGINGFGTATGALQGAMTGVSNAWASLGQAAGSVMSGNFAQAGSQLSAGFQGQQMAQGAAAFAGATPTGLPTVPGDAANVLSNPGTSVFTGATPTGLPTVPGDAANVVNSSPNTGLIGRAWNGLGPYGKAAAVSSTAQLGGAAYTDYKTKRAQEEEYRQRNVNIGTPIYDYA